MVHLVSYGKNKYRAIVIICSVMSGLVVYIFLTLAHVFDQKRPCSFFIIIVRPKSNSNNNYYLVK